MRWLGFTFIDSFLALDVPPPQQVRAHWLSSESKPLELHVSTNNDSVIASIVVFDPDGGLFGGEVCMCSDRTRWSSTNV